MGVHLKDLLIDKYKQDRGHEEDNGRNDTKRFRDFLFLLIPVVA